MLGKKGYTINPFLCTAAHLNPAVARLCCGGSRWSKVAWVLLVWILDNAVTVDIKVSLIQWSDGGKRALRKFDRFGRVRLLERIHWGPVTFTENQISTGYGDSYRLGTDPRRSVTPPPSPILVK
jgi:hypothetical protein